MVVEKRYGDSLTVRYLEEDALIFDIKVVNLERTINAYVVYTGIAERNT